jgi:hypothetical protein
MRRSALAVLVPILAASCVAPPVGGPPPRPARPVTVAPPPAAVAPPAPVQPGAVEAGTWSYARMSDSTAARFSSGDNVRFALMCRLTERNVMIQFARKQHSIGEADLVLRGSTATKAFRAKTTVGFVTYVSVPATDPILDAIAFSRGRFGASVDGDERWYPAWPEIARVVEDCRA